MDWLATQSNEWFGPLWGPAFYETTTSLAFIVAILVPLILSVAYLTLWERKLIGWMQIRLGPNRVGPIGLLQPFADVLKPQLGMATVAAVGKRTKKKEGEEAPESPSDDKEPDDVAGVVNLRKLAAVSDAFAPMVYTGGALRGFDATYGYVTRSLRLLRVHTGDPEVAIHVIGGVANRLGPEELAGFVAAVGDDGGTIGVSLYDWMTTPPASWRSLALLNR